MDISQLETRLEQYRADNLLKTIEGINTLVEYSWELRRRGFFFDRALQASLEAENLLKDVTNRYGEACCYRNLTWLYVDQNDFEKVFFYVNKALQLALDDRLTHLFPELFGGLGIAYWKLKRLPEAREAFQRQLEFSQLNSNQLQIARALNNLGLILGELTDYEGSKRHYQAALKIFEGLGDVASQAGSANNLAKVSQNLDNVETAIAWASRALELAQETEDQRLRSIVYVTNSILWSSTGKHEQALELLQQGIRFAEENDQIFARANFTRRIGIIYFEQNNLEQAHTYLNKAQSLYTQMQNKGGMADTHEWLSKVHEAREEFRKAFNHQKIMQSLKAELAEKTKDLSIKSLKIMREIDIAGLEDEIDRIKTVDLIAARDKAEAANLAKSHFLAKMSHEFRTPLNAIIGYSELIQEEGLNSMSDVQRINTSARHLLNLINDVLDVSKIESGELELQEAQFAIGDLVDQVKEIVSPLIGRNQNVFTIQNQLLDDLNVVGDKLRVCQILVNLIDNALKFTKEGEVELVIKQKGEQELVFKIKDDGIGIQQDQLGNLFQPFKQANNAYNREYDGTGLGLTICKQLAEMMDGEIVVESELGIGSEFTVCLPIRQIEDADS